MDNKSKLEIIDHYRSLLQKHGLTPEGVQYSNAEGQRFRFERLTQIGDLSHRSVLDLGAGLGDLYAYLNQRFDEIKYTGIDIVPESVVAASQRYPGVRFLCRDLQTDGIDEDFEYVLICGMFNNAIPNCTEFLKEMIGVAFDHCTLGLGFNFISRHVNFESVGMAYHDPVEILDFCIQNLSRKVTIHHHYDRCDVAVFVYR